VGRTRVSTAIRGGNQVANFGGTVVRRDLAPFVAWQR
jgi:hypothetical protein